MDFSVLLSNCREFIPARWRRTFFLRYLTCPGVPGRQRSWVSVIVPALIGYLFSGAVAYAQTPCTLPDAAITNTGAANCVGAASLSASSSQSMARIDWFRSGTVVASANAQSAVTGSTVAGGNGQGSGLDQLNLPQGVFVDASGAVYVADYDNHRVQKWLPGATSGITVAGGNEQGTNNNQLSRPTGIFVDAAGAVYVSCSGSARVMKWAAGATSGTTVAGSSTGFAGSTDNLLNSPGALYVDASGAVYVADANNFRVQKWAAGATSGTTVAGGNGQGSNPNQFSFVSGMAVDAAGAVYVADGGMSRVMKWAKGSTSGTLVAGGNGQGNAANQLNNPRGLFINSSGDLYIADMTNQRVQKWAAGAVSGTTVAGGNGFNIEGGAYFNSPIAVHVDGAGSVYVADVGNNRIQKWLSTNVLYVPPVPGVYSALITGTNGCTALSNSITITPTFALTISASPSLTVSPDQRATLTATGADSYTWSTGARTASVSVNTPNVYSVTGLSGGCLAVSSITVVAPACVAPSVSLTNTGAASCIGVASLTVLNDQVPLRVSWYNGTTLVSSAYAFTATTAAAGNGQGAGLNQLDLPGGIYVDAAGAVYVADFNNHRVVKWTAGATTGVTVAGGNGPGSGANQLNKPNLVFVDAAGAVYVGDRDNNRIMKWAAGATSGTVVAGGNSSGSAANQLNGPEGLYVDGAGNVYITDFNNYRVMKWAPGATSGTVVAGGNGKGNALNQLNNPIGLYLNAAGAVFVSDAANERVVKWAPGATSGTVVAGGNGGGSYATQLYSPRGIFVDASDAVYVADMTNQRVQKWAAGATSGTTVAGGNGYGTDAYGFNSPVNVFVDAAGSVYVTDIGNNRIQKWRPIPINAGFTPQTSGNYTARVTSVAGCTAVTSSLTIGATPNVTVVPASKTITEGQSVTLTAYNGLAHRWPDNSTSATLVVSPAVGTAIYTVTGTTGACSGTATATISVTSCNTPVLSLTNTGAASCVGVTSLTLSSSQLISQADWYKGTTLIHTTKAEAVTAGVTVAGDPDGEAGSGLSQFSYPSGICMDAAGAIYVADFSNNRVLKWLPGATSGILVAGTGGPDGSNAAEDLWGPVGVFVDAGGVLYIADAFNYRVQKWLPGATSGITVAGGNDHGELGIPSGVFVDASGVLYVADQDNNKILKWLPDATEGITVAGANGELTSPSGIFVDAAGTMYIADAGNNRVVKWAAGATSGTVVAGQGGSSGTSASQLDYPASIYVDAAGAVYVADQNNNRIQKWLPGATVGVTVAGTGTESDNEAGKLSGPSGVIVDQNGIIYISDGYNNRIQKWESGEAKLTYTPAETGTYKVMVTMPNGCTAQTNNVLISGPPSLTIVPASQTISVGMSTTLAVSGGTAFTWSSGQSTSAIIVNPVSTTAYSVTVANASGCVSETSATVTVVPAVTAQIGGNLSVCAGSSTTLTAIDLANRPNVSYHWSTGESTTAIVVSPVSTTAYSVTIADAFGGYSSTSVIVSLNPAVTVSVAGNLSVCPGFSTTLSATDLTGGQSLTYSWSDGTSLSAIVVSPASTTAYSVTLTNASGCASSTTVTVTVNPAATAVIGGSLTICPGQSTTLTAQGGTSYTWSTGSSLSAVVVSPASTTAYSLTVVTASGCVASTSVTVSVNASVAAGISGNLTICRGQSTTLTASGAPTVLWSTGAASADLVVAPVSTTAYSVTVSSGAGCQSTTSVTVTVNPAATATIGGTLTICPGLSTTLTATGGQSYLWSTGASLSAIVVSPASTTAYSVTVTNASGCASVTGVTVSVNPAAVAAISGGLAICTAGSTTLTASDMGGGQGTNYLWSTGENTAAVTVSPVSTTAYSVTVTNATGCRSVTSVTVSVNPAVTATVSGNLTICAGTGTQLTASGGSTYLWSTGENTASVTVSPVSTTAYSVTVSNGSGCWSVTGVTVSVNPAVTAAISGNLTLCAGQSTTLTATGGSSYRWSTGATGPVLSLTPVMTDVYPVTVTNGSGCTAVVIATVIVNSVLTAQATQAVVSGVLGASSCSVRITGTGIGDRFEITGPGGYVFSTVYRNGGTHPFATTATITKPGTYTYTAYYINPCGGLSQDQRTVIVTGTACP